MCVFAFQQQFEAYVAWINSQLKKKPGVRLIEDLRQDMKDGVNFAHIIEVVCTYYYVYLS